MKRRWTDEELVKLERLYPDTPTKRIAKMLGRSVGTVYNRAQKMGLRKSAGHLGKVGVLFGFKKGNSPANRFQIGDEVIRSGYLHRKLCDTGCPRRDWRPVHVLLWEEAYGPVPKGHAIVFVNGDPKDIRLGNLAIVSRADLMRRNHYQRNYPPEICYAIQLRGALVRQINKRERATA